jgi:hypothetical protein
MSDESFRRRRESENAYFEELYDEVISLRATVASLTEERDGLLKELDEEREKVGLLLQPKPTDLPGDFPWQMMRQWCANRDAEKRAARTALQEMTEERDRLQAVVEALPRWRQALHEPVIAAHEAILTVRDEMGAAVRGLEKS